MASLVKKRICVLASMYKWVVVVVEIESHAAGLFCFQDFVLQKKYGLKLKKHVAFSINK